MVSQTMLSSAPNGNSEPDLTRQPSIYSLTLQEIQNAMNEPGKSFGSMNMEEFMKSLWTAEESQAMVAAMASSAENNVLNRQTSLQRLNSLSLPPTLSRKTVEDVWKDIQRQPVTDSIDGHSQSQQPQNQQHGQQQRQIGLGDMTLEDFLARAGVVSEDPQASRHVLDGGNSISLYSVCPSASVPNSLSSAMGALTSSSLQTKWMNFESHGQILQQADAATLLARRELPLASLTGDTMYDRVTDGTGLGPDSICSSLDLSPDYSLRSSRKRLTCEAVVEKTVERRQKRMIKNRESAARSRARKQAYTVELEAEVTRLKEENERLKQEQASVSCLPESRYSKKLKIHVLRRTRSWC